MITRRNELKHFFCRVESFILLVKWVHVLVVVRIERVDEVALLIDKITDNSFFLWIKSEKFVVGFETRCRLALQVFHFLRIKVSFQESEITANEIDIGRMLRLPII